MDPVAAALIGFLLGALLAGVLCWVLARRMAHTRQTTATRLATAEREQAIALANASHETAISEERRRAAEAASTIHADLAAAQAAIDGLQQQTQAAAIQYRELLERGERDAKERQAQQQTESKVLQALTPVQETLRTMQSKVTELEEQRQRQHGELQHQLKAATEGEERLRATAESLASALKNNAVRGVWGETQLRTLVESAGLIAHVDFTEQATITVDEASRRPDMVINLPGGKQIAVDSKVPYNDYIEASAIPASATGEEDERRRELFSRHAKRVKAHVDALAAKGYWNGLESSPDFTIAFIPNESLLATALNADPGLLEYAFGRSVILASPVSFWAALKTVAFTWRQDVLTEDAKRLFDLSRELYGRISTLADHADKLRRSIDGTVASYNAFASSLETRVLVTARKLGDLDESKVLAEPRPVEERPKQLTAPELTVALSDDTLELVDLVDDDEDALP